MKTKKKLLIALLSATCLVAGAFGFAACKTDKGEQGEAGAQGAAGAPGTDGKSAYELYLESLGPDDVQLSETEWLKSLIGTNGLPGATGNGVQSVELSADNRNLIVTYTNGDTDVILLPESFSHKHSYGVDYTTIIEPTQSVEGLGYKNCISSSCDHVETVVLPKLGTQSGSGTTNSPYVLSGPSTVGEKNTYKLSATKASGVWENVNVRLSAGSSAVKYKVTVNSNSVAYNNLNEFTVVLDAWESFDAALKVSSNSADATYDFDVTLERMVTPEKGSAEFPYTIYLGEYASNIAEAAANTDVYFVLKQNNGVKYMFEFGSNVSITSLGASIEGNTPSQVVSGEVISLSSQYSYYYKVSATDGAISFKMFEQGAPGDRNNPIPVTLGTATEVTGSGWFAVTFPAQGKYTVEATTDSASLVSFNVYSDNSSNYYSSLLTSFNEQAVHTYNFEANTYYFQTYYSGFTFNVREYDAAKDDGKSASVPVNATLGTVYNVAAGESLYLVYTATDNAIVSFNADDGVTAVVCYGADFDTGNMGDNVIKNNSELLYTGDSVSITLTGRGGGTFKLESNDVNTPVALTLKTVDYRNNETAISGAVIKVYKAGELVATSDQTGVDGTVVLNLLPEYYTVTVEKAGYAYIKGDNISLKTEECELVFILDEAEEHTVKVMFEGEGVADVEVYYSAYMVYSTSAVTNADGEATLLIPKNATARFYDFGVDTDDYDYASTPEWDSSVTVHVIELQEPIEYTVINLVGGTEGNVSTDVTAYYQFGTDQNLTVTVSGGHIEFMVANDGDYEDTIVAYGKCTYADDGDTNTCVLLWLMENYNTIYMTIVPDAGQTATVTITL